MVYFATTSVNKHEQRYIVGWTSPFDLDVRLFLSVLAAVSTKPTLDLVD